MVCYEVDVTYDLFEGIIVFLFIGVITHLT